MPVKRGIVDVYIDDYSTSNNIFAFNSYGIEEIAPFIKRSGKITGIFGDYKLAPKGLANFAKQQTNFTQSKMMTMSMLKYGWQQCGIKINDTKSIGFTSETNPDYVFDVQGEKVQVYGYSAVKSG